MCYETELTKGKTTTELINLYFGIEDGNKYFRNFLDSMKLHTHKLVASKFIRELVIKCGSLANSQGITIKSLLVLGSDKAIPLIKLDVFNHKETVLDIQDELAIKSITDNYIRE